MSYFTVITTCRTFRIEAAGIGDAIDRALSIIVPERETILKVSA